MMQNYVIFFTDNQGNESETSVVAANETKARKAFSTKHPDIGEENITDVQVASNVSQKQTASTGESQSPESGHSFQGNTKTGVSITPKEDYKAARFCTKTLEFIGWAIIIFGVITAFNLGSQRTALYMGFLMGGETAAFFALLTAGFAGLVLILAGQIARAVVENANNTRAILHALQQNSQG